MLAKDFYATLSKGEKRYLSRFECAWCDQNMGRSECSSIYDPCPDEKRINKAKRCLGGYKPRKGNANGEV